MLRLLVSWLLCLPLAFAITLAPAAATEGHSHDGSCPIEADPSVELLSTLDVDRVVGEAQDDASGSGCVTSCVNLAGSASPGSPMFLPSSAVLQVATDGWLSTSPERLERPPRV
ncbi:hypothetical protein [Halomonas sp. RA08-2]|uniref:hypothetical protein n=1 Tax=Halomonas sp. RA08-2 TaxID=3440842 RepID=UPI003EF01890